MTIYAQLGLHNDRLHRTSHGIGVCLECCSWHLQWQVRVGQHDSSHLQALSTDRCCDNESRDYYLRPSCAEVGPKAGLGGWKKLIAGGIGDWTFVQKIEMGDEARAKAKAKRVIGRTAPPRFVLYSENSITKPEVTILVPMPSGAVKAQAVSPINWRIADR